jgi:hypothetical protein
MRFLYGGSGGDHQQQQQHLSSSASSEQLSLLPMFQTTYGDIEDRRITIR